MSTIKQFYSKEELQEQAALWISRIDRGLSEAEKASLSKWVSESKAHQDALFEMASYWDDLSVLNELSVLFPLETAKSKSKWQYAAIAASVLLLSLIGGNWLLGGQISQHIWGGGEVYTQRLESPVGKQTSFSLPDGTQVQLNTNSVVEVDYSSNYRQLTLVTGEAKFDVAKDRSKPFTVTAGVQAFTALGTVFNVQKNDEQDMELVVTHGKVLVTSVDKSLEQIKESLNDTAEKSLPGLLVSTGEKVVIAKNISLAVETLPLEQMQRDLAWQQGMLIFEGEPLSQALDDVSRYTSVKFEIVDPELSELKVAGYFKAGDVDGLLASLSSNFNIVHVKDSDNIIHLTASSNTNPTKKLTIQ
ncbi:FecR family protein [Shewanella nanhaiensis]|uniref:FecR domain-containing protein n=1 Tax=Shewanella nanhaiensis TaxID=2864872 RepID=A0ABS7E1Z1_9GAMM|nr:FecR domain-containing protein [Shewanella nanhaiensis]MBW8183181.1 FecR domain-containing protein [Shewanella nanhaiensis]